ncbi:hypothetical protein [Streptomyces odontomachi]|uniref:hypothetical protein n=1 Tax=Streptomyces odontomachi TaxID=2944940 RepID=UPI00210C463C|nr:hypothetical protein [Streptomyces sp. ODS25]
MDLDTLRFANFTLLDEAVSDWSTLVDHLKDLEHDAENGLHKAANKANWAGANAKVTREFIGKTAGEFTDAHTQARTLHRILSDTRDELKKFHKDLNDAIERGLKKNLTVVDTGDGGFTVTMNVHPDRAAQGHQVPEHEESDVTALHDEVQGILSRATDSDNSAKKVLTAIVDQSRLGFSDANYKDRDSAAAAIKAADDLARLAKKKPEDLTPQEFDRLNAGLKKYHNDPLFAERFATDLGPKRTLEFWAGISDPAVAPDISRQRRDDLGELQKNLSMTLATASQSDTGAMTDWKHRMTDLGDQPVGKRAGVLGFQVMSNLMRAGDYDDDFLADYGKNLMAAERKHTENGEHVAWQRLGPDPFLNHMKGDSGWDPMTGYLKGLSNSPAAATEFFNDEFLPADSDHKHAVSNFKYLFEDRHWPHETTLGGDESNDGRNTLARALEAATTGHPAGELPTADTPAHNADQAHLMSSIMASVSKDPSRLLDHSYMSDSLGQMASEYLPDINRSLTDDAGSDDIKKLFPIDGSPAHPSHTDVTRFLVAVGQDPKAYSAISVGQQDYMARLLDHHLNPDLPADQRYPGSPEDTIKAITRQSAEIGGTLAIGEQQALLQQGADKDSEFAYHMSQRKNLVSGIAGTAIGMGTALIPTPVVSAGASGVAGTVSSMVIEAMFKDKEGSALADSAHDAGVLWGESKTAHTALNRTAVTKAAEAYGLDYADQIGDWTRDATKDGFDDASSNARRMALDMDIEIPD